MLGRYGREKEKGERRKEKRLRGEMGEEENWGRRGSRRGGGREKVRKIEVEDSKGQGREDNEEEIFVR